MPCSGKAGVANERNMLIPFNVRLADESVSYDEQNVLNKWKTVFSLSDLLSPVDACHTPGNNATDSEPSINDIDDGTYVNNDDGFKGDRQDVIYVIHKQNHKRLQESMSYLLRK